MSVLFQKTYNIIFAKVNTFDFYPICQMVRKWCLSLTCELSAEVSCKKKNILVFRKHRIDLLFLCSHISFFSNASCMPV